MIFVTVGTQLPFDRMVRAIDMWASARPYADAFAQIGPAQYQPKHIPWAEFLDANECRRKTEQADVVVAHAGMGSILTALELGRPVVVMPRLSALGEHRNDHQLDTAKKLLAQGRIFVAFDEQQLLAKLEYLNKLMPAERISVHASDSLIATLRSFVGGQEPELPILINPSQAASPDLILRKDRPDHLQANSIRSRGKSATSEGEEPGWNGSRVGLLLEEPRPGWELINRGRFDSGANRRHYSGDVIRSGLVAVVLLGGRLRTTDLGRRIGRSRLDLPLDENRSLLSYWRDEASELAESWGCRPLEIRVLIDQSSATPTVPRGSANVTVSVERDRAEFRGTGGVLKDVCGRYDDDAWILVANAAQILFEPLTNIAEKLANAGGEINLVNDQEGIPNGLILLRCGALGTVSDLGFHDMKEQVVPALSGRNLVKVVRNRGGASAPIHELGDYTAALRRYHSQIVPRNGKNGGLDEGWQPRFAIREQGSFVDASAVIHDSVVLEGAAIESGAVVVRSVVGRGARVSPGKVVIDQVVC